MSSRDESFGTALMWAIAGSAFIGTMLIIGWFMIFLAPIYIGYRLYQDSPARKERVAREHTIALYEAAIGTSLYRSSARKASMLSHGDRT